MLNNLCGNILFQLQHIPMLSLEMTRSGQLGVDGMHYCAVFTVQTKKKSLGETIKKNILAIDGVLALEEL